MEAELHVNGDRPSPGSPRTPTATTALAGRENYCFSGDRRRSTRACSTPAAAAAPDGMGDSRSSRLTTSIQSVGEGNYGRLGPASSSATPTPTPRRCSPSPRPADTPDEQPGAMPEIFPSPHATRARRTSTAAGPAGRCSCRPGATTAPRGRSSTSGSACDPYLNAAVLQFVPQVPQGQPSVAGLEHPARAAARSASSRRTRRGLHDEGRRHAYAGPRAGHRPHAAAGVPGRRRSCSTASRVKHYDARETNRGLEVTVAAGRAQHTLTITTR